MPLIEENYVPGTLHRACRDRMPNHENPSDHASGIASHENSEVYKIEWPAIIAYKAEVVYTSLSMKRARGHKARCMCR